MPVWSRLARRGRCLPPEPIRQRKSSGWLLPQSRAKKQKGGKPAKTPDARSARRENARACREAVQGDKRSREAQAGETSPAQSLAAWHAFAGQYFPALVDRPAVVHGGGVLLPVAFPLLELPDFVPAAAALLAACAAFCRALACFSAHSPLAMFSF